MGLDMYLTRKKFIGRNWDGKAESNKVTIKDGTGKDITVDMKEVCELVFDAGYWRKANAIHNWFVREVQDGNDNCGDYYVSREKLAELLDTVNQVLDASKLVKGKIQNGSINGVPNMIDGKYVEDYSVADELLPTGSGFFFGSTDYDEWYIRDLKETKKILTKALANKDGDDFYYHSSW